MSDKSIHEFIQSILGKHKGFMKVKDLLKPVKDFVKSISLDDKRKLGLMGKNITNKTLQQILEDKFIFARNGSTQYILVPCDPSEIMLAALSDKPVSPKFIAKTLPFSKQDFINMLNELEESGKIRIILNENYEPRIILSDIHEGHHEENRVHSSGEYTQERFKAAFDELERGRVFVNIPELRKKLNWPHDVFDEMIRKLRDEEIITLHVTDRTRFEPEEFFYDDDNSRIGMVTWNEEQQINS